MGNELFYFLWFFLIIHYFYVKKTLINIGEKGLQQDFNKNLFFLLKKGLRDTVVMVRRPFTGIVLAFVGVVGSVNYWFD